MKEQTNKKPVQKEPTQDFKKLLLELERRITLLPLNELREIRNGEWDSNFSIEKGIPIINICGPDCDTWATNTFEELIEEFVGSIKEKFFDDYEMKDGATKRVATAWINKLQWAIIEIEKATKSK